MEDSEKLRQVLASYYFGKGLPSFPRLQKHFQSLSFRHYLMKQMQLSSLRFIQEIRRYHSDSTAFDLRRNPLIMLPRIQVPIGAIFATVAFASVFVIDATAATDTDQADAVVGSAPAFGSRLRYRWLDYGQ